MAYTNKAHGSTTPQSNFATRKLAFVVIDMNTDVETNYDQIGSLFQKAVQGIQQVAEFYALGNPSGNYFTAILSDDTLPYGDGEAMGDGGRNSALEAAINETTGASCNAWNAVLNGDSLNYD
jgi:hypothetical protein